MEVTRRFLTIADVAEVLATSEAQVLALVRRGDLRALKLGGRGQWRVSVEDLEAFIAQAYADTAAHLQSAELSAPDA